ncbi:MAG: SGNH/GDSL hydrolase family protein [Galactobacter sp.]
MECVSENENAATPPWRRMVSIGDSFTEGIGDPDENVPGGFRGWADRVAEHFAEQVPDFAYANLAIRGRLIQQIDDEQIEPALALNPDLITLCAGGNDVLRGGDPDKLAGQLDRMVSRLETTGATIVLFAGPDIGDTPVMKLLRGRVAIFNENVRTVARRHGAVVADVWSLRELHRPDMWAEDRLHFSALGHHTIARLVLESLNVSNDLDRDLPAPPVTKPWRQARADDLLWAREHLVPWFGRRIKHVSSGDGVTAKRPLPSPVFGAANGPHDGQPQD